MKLLQDPRDISDVEATSRLMTTSTQEPQHGRLVDEEVEEDEDEEKEEKGGRRDEMVEEMKAVRGKHLARNPGETVFRVYRIKLSCLIETPLDCGGSGARNSNQVVFLV